MASRLKTLVAAGVMAIGSLAAAGPARAAICRPMASPAHSRRIPCAGTSRHATACGPGMRAPAGVTAITTATGGVTATTEATFEAGPMSSSGTTLGGQHIGYVEQVGHHGMCTDDRSGRGSR